MNSPVPLDVVLYGICRQPGGPDYFSQDPSEMRRAVNWCVPCPVRFECLQYAISVPEIWGVWGGNDQVQIRQACAVDHNGDPVKRPQSAKCPFCRTTKNVTEVREAASRGSQASCSECGLTWRRAKSHVKKTRTRSIIPVKQAVSDAA